MRPVFDTNVFHEYGKMLTDKDIAKMSLSVIVLYELTATTIDSSVWRKYESWRKSFEEAGLLLVPSVTNWWESAKVVSRLRWGAKSASRGKTPPDPNAYKLQNDVLIARTAAMNECYVVTSDINDFHKIARYMEKLVIIDSKDYFGV